MEEYERVESDRTTFLVYIQNLNKSVFVLFQEATEVRRGTCEGSTKVEDNLNKGRNQIHRMAINTSELQDSVFMAMKSTFMVMENY